MTQPEWKRADAAAVQAVIMDVDGTLVPEGTDLFPEDLLPLIPALEAHGIHVATASGRSWSSLRQLFAPVREQMSFLCESGTLICSGDGTLIQTFPLEREIVEILFDLAWQCGDTEILLGCAGTSYVHPKSGVFVHLMREIKKTQITLVESVEEIREPVCKISTWSPDGVETFRTLLDRAGRPDCLITDSAENWLDFSRAGKSDGIRILLERFHLDARNVLYFGDSGNDLGALRMVGHPWVMTHATPALLAEFPCRTDSVTATLKNLLQALES